MKSVACPNCKKQVPWTDKSRWKPFCSERCRLADLGDWFDEKHRIATEDESQEFILPDPDHLM